MEEKKILKISFNKVLIILLCMGIAICSLILMKLNSNNDSKKNIEKNSSNKSKNVYYVDLDEYINYEEFINDEKLEGMKEVHLLKGLDVYNGDINMEDEMPKGIISSRIIAKGYYDTTKNSITVFQCDDDFYISSKN